MLRHDVHMHNYSKPIRHSIAIISLLGLLIPMVFPHPADGEPLDLSADKKPVAIIVANGMTNKACVIKADVNVVSVEYLSAIPYKKEVPWESVAECTKWLRNEHAALLSSVMSNSLIAFISGDEARAQQLFNLIRRQRRLCDEQAYQLFSKRRDELLQAAEDARNKRLAEEKYIDVTNRVAKCLELLRLNKGGPAMSVLSSLANDLDVLSGADRNAFTASWNTEWAAFIIRVMDAARSAYERNEDEVARGYADFVAVNSGCIDPATYRRFSDECKRRDIKKRMVQCFDLLRQNKAIEAGEMHASLSNKFYIISHEEQQEYNTKWNKEWTALVVRAMADAQRAYEARDIDAARERANFVKKNKPFIDITTYNAFTNDCARRDVLVRMAKCFELVKQDQGEAAMGMHSGLIDDINILSATEREEYKQRFNTEWPALVVRAMADARRAYEAKELRAARGYVEFVKANARFVDAEMYRSFSEESARRDAMVVKEQAELAVAAAYREKLQRQIREQEEFQRRLVQAAEQKVMQERQAAAERAWLQQQVFAQQYAMWRADLQLRQQALEQDNAIRRDEMRMQLFNNALQQSLMPVYPVQPVNMFHRNRGSGYIHTPSGSIPFDYREW